MIPSFSEAKRVADNRSRFMQLTDAPMGSVDWSAAEQQAQAMQPAPQMQAPAPAMPMPSNGPTSPGSRFGGQAMIPPGSKLIQPPGFAMGGTVPSFGMAPIGSSAKGNGPPGSFWDEATKSWVVGINTAQGRDNYLKARGGNTASGGQVRDGVNYNYDGAGARFGMGGGAPAGQTIGGRMPTMPPSAMMQPEADPFSPDTVFDPATGKYVPRFARGGTIYGPGGPTDDKVPALVNGVQPIAVSDGEEIVDAATRDFFGRKFFLDLKKKAEKGLMEAGEEQPSSMPKDGPMPGFAAGGTISNPYADDPMAAALAEQRGKDERLAAIGGADFGAGRAGFVNRYGSGYAVPAGNPMDVAGPGRFSNNGDAMTAQPGGGMMPVPDIVPAGPWSNGAAPFDATANRESIDFALRQMQQTAPQERAIDLHSNAQRLQFVPKGPKEISVPDARPNFGFGPGEESDGSMGFRGGLFKSPSEKDAEAAAARNAPIQPLLDAGMRKTDIRRMMKTPQGVALMQDMQPDQWTPIPGADYLQNRKGQTVPMRGGAQSKPAPAPEEIARLDGIIEDKSQPLAVRELAKRQKEKVARQVIAGGATKPNPGDTIQSTKDVNGVPYVVMKDGTMKRPIIENPDPALKKEAFKKLYGREPESEQDWSEAYYLASGKPRGEAAAPEAKAAPASPGPNERHAAALKANPSLAAQFDAKFGPGSAARILGK